MGERRTVGRSRRTRATILEAVAIVLLSLVLVFGVMRPFVVELFRIPSESMSPTLEAGDRVVVNKLAYRLGEPGRGELVTLQTRRAGVEPIIKRVVGLPGDEVEIRDGVLVINGERNREHYVDYNLVDSTFFGPETVPPGSVFVLGDNRSNSRDSRHWGAVPEPDLLGRVTARVWPPGRLSFL